MDVLHVVLVVLVAVAIWAVVELALTIRRARSSVEEVTRSANEAIAQVQPIISKADGMVDDLQPAVKQVQPLIEKANTAVDVATVDLASLNDILQDVSEVSGTASNVTATVNRVADSAATGVANVVGKITGKPQRRGARLAEGASAEPGEASRAAAPEAGAGEPTAAPEASERAYVTYGPARAEGAADGSHEGE